VGQEPARFGENADLLAAESQRRFRVQDEAPASHAVSV
jgi:hypothetical protein